MKPFYFWHKFSINNYFPLPFSNVQSHHMLATCYNAIAILKKHHNKHLIFKYNLFQCLELFIPGLWHASCVCDTTQTMIFCKPNRAKKKREIVTISAQCENVDIYFWFCLHSILSLRVIKFIPVWPKHKINTSSQVQIYCAHT